jgi:hypothetical protein
MNIVCTPLDPQHSDGGTHLFVAVYFHGGSTSGSMESNAQVKTWIAKGRRHSQYVGCAERSINANATAAVKAMWKVF